MISTLPRLLPGLGLWCVAALALSLAGCDQVKEQVRKLPELLKAQEPEVVAPEEPDPVELYADQIDTVIPPPPDPVEMPKTINKDAEVAILGYHDFTEGKSNNDMIINVDDFRSQMQAIKDSGFPVISMSEFLAWKRGEESLPDQCVMITIDDGWKATHTLALPVLKEFEYPFTIFLYKKYVGIGGRSLTHQEVRELVAGGAEIGSHSVSHQNMIQKQGRSPEAYDEWLRVELEESYTFLEETFGDTGKVLKVFAYPFGIYSDEVVQKAEAFGYEALFTVNGTRVHWDTPDAELGRYMIYKDDRRNFTSALGFRGATVLAAGRKLLETQETDAGEPQKPLVTTSPAEGETIAERRPLIRMNLAGLEGVDPESISVTISGMGAVPHVYREAEKVIEYQVVQPLRGPRFTVSVRLKHAGNTNTEVIAWSFKLDQVASYLSSPAEEVEEEPPSSGKSPAAASSSPQPVPSASL